MLSHRTVFFLLTSSFLLLTSYFKRPLASSSNAFGSDADHGPKEKDQHANDHQAERSAREKLRYPIQALTAPGLHERDQSQNEPDTITDQRDGSGSFWSTAHRGSGERTANQAKPKEEKRRDSKFAQMIHAPPECRRFCIASNP
jgi:hypothetical protein